MKRIATGFIPEGPLFKSPCVQTNNIPFLPDELISIIMISDFEANNRTFFYLVSKKWIKIFNCDLIPQLLQSQKINLSSIPFIRNLPFLEEKNQLQNSFVFRLNTYIEFLNGKISFENVNRILNSPFRAIEEKIESKKKELYFIHKLTNDEFHAISPNNLKDIAKGIENLQLKILKKPSNDFYFPNLKKLDIEMPISMDFNKFSNLEKLKIFIRMRNSIYPPIKIGIDLLKNLKKLEIKYKSYPFLVMDDNFILPNSLKVATFYNLILPPDYKKLISGKIEINLNDTM